MKVRMGFVSNSSSSSFIVIGDSGKLELDNRNYKDKSITLGNKGETDFGWTRVKYSSVYDRINFAKIQARYMGQKTPPFISLDLENVNDEIGKLALIDILKGDVTYESILDLIIMQHTGAESVTWELSDEAYIDHQSAASEGENLEMFNSKEALIRFLFDSESYIQGGNDNN